MKHNIKNSAEKILKYIYDNCDSILSVKDLDLTRLSAQGIADKNVSRACEYLVQKEFITRDRTQVPIDKITTSITALGIDFVEDKPVC